MSDPTSGDQQSGEADPTQRNTVESDQTPPRVGAGSPPTHADTSPDAKNVWPKYSHIHLKDCWDKATVILLFLAFLAAGAAAYFTYSDKQAAWKQVDIIADTAKKQLRAYVAVTPIELVSVNEGPIKEVPLRVVNSGQTPAYRLAIGVRIFEEQEKKAMSWAWKFSPEREQYESKIGFLPNETIRSFSVDGGSITLDSLVRNDRRMYAVGRVWYDDIYDRAHWTNFCIWWDARTLDATYCDKFNETSKPDE